MAKFQIPNKPDGYVSDIPDFTVYRPVYVAKAHVDPWGKQKSNLEVRIEISHIPEQRYDWYTIRICLPNYPRAARAKWNIIKAIEYNLRTEVKATMEAGGWIFDVDLLWEIVIAPFDIVSKAVIG